MLGKTLRLYKREKLCSVRSIERLFAARPPKNATSTDSLGTIGVALAYPLRMVFGENPRRGGAPVQFLISVPKKRLRHAVDRVTMRRRIREAYRNVRGDVACVDADSLHIDVAFIYVADTLVDYDKVHRAMSRLVAKLKSMPTTNADSALTPAEP